MFDLEKCVGFTINTVSKQVSDAFTEQLRLKEISNIKWTALFF